MESFKRTFRVEWKKASHSRMFLISLGLGILFATMAFLYNLDFYRECLEDIQLAIEWEEDPCYGMIGLYNRWIGGEAFSLGYLLFFILLPLLASIPYGDSLCLERNTGYIRNVVIKVGWRVYLSAKVCAAFLTGALALLIPLACNLILTACFIPAYEPDILYRGHYANWSGSMWSVLFYTYPLIHTLLYLLLDFLFGGIFAVMSTSVGAFCNRRIVAIAIPYLLMLGLKYITNFSAQVYGYELSPLAFLHAHGLPMPIDGRLVAAEAILFAGVSFLILTIRGKKNEIY